MAVFGASGNTGITGGKPPLYEHSYIPDDPGAFGSQGTPLTKMAEAQKTAERGQRAGSAFEAAKKANEAGIGYNTSYTDPFTGVSYSYQGSGKAGGAAGDAGSGAGGRMVDWNAAMSAINPMLPQTPAREALPAHVTGPSQADRRAAESAAFARAKDRIGQTGSGAMTALTRAMSRRGLTGSGIEGAQMGNLVSNTRGQLGDVIRDQTIEGLRRDQAVEDRNYAGDISQRSADMGYNTTQRGQDIEAMGQRTNAVNSLMSLYRQYQQGARPGTPTY